MISLNYVFVSPNLNNNSVYNKIIEQILALRHNGIDAKGVFFTHEQTSLKSDVYDVVYVPKVKKKYFVSFKQRMLFHKSIYDYYKNRKEQVEFIYLRYNGASKFINKLMDIIGHKIFIEHITAEIPEIELYKSENSIQFNLSSILSHFEFRYLPIIQEYLYGKMIRRKALFGIANSNNLLEYENRFARKDYIKIIGGDAVNSNNFKVHTLIEKNGGINCIFLKGASTSSIYNGLDRIFLGLVKYSGDEKINIYICGKNLSWESNEILRLKLEDKVKLVEYLQSDDLDLFMNKIDIGLSQFGVHRKGLTSTTTIKSREYFARGLPFIFGHHDPDISDNPEAKNYVLEFPADDSPVDFEKVIDWYRNTILPQKDIGENMHAYALKYLDYNVKMKRLAEHLITYT